MPPLLLASAAVHSQTVAINLAHCITQITLQLYHLR